MTLTSILKVTNEHGMHLRPAGILSEIANSSKNRDLGVFLMSNGMRVDAKSVFNIVALGASMGTSVILDIECENETEENVANAESLLKEIEDFFNSGFDIAEVKE